jgi:hypothetical protein
LLSLLCSLDLLFAHSIDSTPPSCFDYELFSMLERIGPVSGTKRSPPAALDLAWSIL